MNKKPWMLPLKQLLKKISQKEVWEYDPHAYHPRLSDIASDSKCMALLNLSRREIVCIDSSGEFIGRQENGLHETTLPNLLA